MIKGQDGQTRLVRHLHSVGRMVESTQPPAQERLRATLGDAVTDLLLSILAPEATAQAKQESQEEIV
jgi:hypothetical protein